jgi:4-amino-4-deoxy-L-arabinose transferase-like glycosyltransferase
MGAKFLNRAESDSLNHSMNLRNDFDTSSQPPLKVMPGGSVNASKRQPVVPLVFGAACLAALIFLPALGAYNMLDPTDSFFVEAPREMLILHHYMTPLINYADWFDKPAFPFLLTVLTYKCFGVSAWAARLPSALSAILLVVATAFATIKLLNRRTALLAPLVLSTCPLFIVVGRLALTDEPLSMFIGVAMLAFALSLFNAQKRYFLVAYLMLGLAALCKGPIGLILAGGSLFCYGLLEVAHEKAPPLKLFNFIQTLNPLIGLAIVLLISAPYYIAAHLTTHGAFTQEFFLHQNVGRFEGTVNHQEPIWWYVPIFLGGLFPWTLFLLPSYPIYKHLWKARQWTTRQKLMVFSAAWLLFVLALFTAVPTKLPTYIVPICPAFAVIVANNLDMLLRLKRKRYFQFSAGLMAIAAIGGAILLPRLLPVSGNVSNWLLAMVAIICIFQVSQFLQARANHLVNALRLQCAGTVFICATLIPYIFCLFFWSHQTRIDRLVARALHENANLATLFNSVPSAVFAYNRRVEMLDSFEQVEKFANQGPSPHWLLATKNCFDMQKLNAHENMIARDGKWYLISVESLNHSKH